MTYYKITNLEVGYADSPADFCFDGNLWPGKCIYSPFSMTLIQGEGHNILVDTGIDVSLPKKKAIAEAAFVRNCHAPDEVLNSIGVDVNDIDAVFLTHLHFDHAGGVNCFPNAVFYVQKAELEGWEKCTAHKKFSNLWMSVDPDDFVILRDLERKNRLVLLDGDQEAVFPGIDVIGFQLEHSFASQTILVHTQSGLTFPDTEERFLIVGDIGRYPENYFGTDNSTDYIFNVKFGIGSPYHLALAYDRIFRLAGGQLSRIIMTHDGTKAQRYLTRKTDLGLQVSICNE